MTVSYNSNGALSPSMLTIAEVADLLHVHPNSIRNWSNKGLLKAYRIGYRHDRRFRLHDIDEFLLNKQG